MKKLILASKSPRRQDLLARLEYTFEIRTKEIEENYPDDLAPSKIPEFLSKLKASPFEKELQDEEILITSDTIVILNDEVLEKPKDRPDAIQMLSKLSGSTHSVITAVSLTSNKKQVSFSDETMVTFKDITQAQIEHYVDDYEPYDKAGSYGIQEWLGYIAIEKIEGCYFNVMGFPLRLVYEEIEKF